MWCLQVSADSSVKLGRFQVFSLLLNSVFLQLPLLKHFLILASAIQTQSLVIPLPGAQFCLCFVDGVFTEMSPKTLLLHFSEFFMLLSQLVQGKIFKLECHPHKNAECFADFCEFTSLGSYNGCWIVYWMWFFFISSLNFIYQGEWSLGSSLSAPSGMATSECPVLNFFACVHEGRKHIDFPPKDKRNKGHSSSHSNLCKINA